MSASFCDYCNTFNAGGSSHECAAIREIEQLKNKLENTQKELHASELLRELIPEENAELEKRIDALEANLTQTRDGWKIETELHIEREMALRARITELQRSGAKALSEILRLKNGQMTVEEVHNLCHNLSRTVSAQEFADGCAAEQRKYYGCAPDRDALNVLRIRIEALISSFEKNGARPTEKENLVGMILIEFERMVGAALRAQLTEDKANGKF